MDAALLIRVMGEPMRYQIFRLLLQQKHCVRSLSKKLGVSESAVSQHLRLMRQAGLVYGEKYGYLTHYFPDPDAISLLVSTFLQIQAQSQELNRDAGTCQCEFQQPATHKG